MSRTRATLAAVSSGLLLVLAAGCSGDDGAGGGGSSGDFCTDMARFEALQAEGDAAFASGDDPATVREVFDRFSDAIEAARASVPDEIATDYRLVADTTQRLIETFESADYDLAALATDPQYAEVLVSLDDARVTEANDRLATYVRTTCGTRVTGDAPATTAP